MRKEIGTPVIVVIVLALVAVLGVVGYRVLGSPKSGMTAEQQKEAMRHMIPVKK